MQNNTNDVKCYVKNAVQRKKTECLKMKLKLNSILQTSRLSIPKFRKVNHCNKPLELQFSINDLEEKIIAELYMLKLYCS